jgi:hypothetical protein
LKKKFEEKESSIPFGLIILVLGNYSSPKCLPESLLEVSPEVPLKKIS